MHRRYRYDISDLLSHDGGELAVSITSPYAYTDARTAELGARPAATDEPFNMIRKMACNYGWDWGPTLVTAGIWRPVRLESWRTARLDAVRPLLDVRADDTGTVTVHVDVERAAGEPAPLQLVAEIAGETATAQIAPESASATVVLAVPRVERWWPRGFGEQTRYELVVRLSGDSELDTWRRQVGFRTVTLDQRAESDGARFSVVVNDQPVFARGADWIPDDCFPSRIGPERYRHRLRQATDAGVNFLRVWGGGLYESDAFYAACDELGVLVWQDFLFSCAAYPEEEPFASEVALEARDNVTRLAPHPSLAIWNGNNENLWGHQDWGWQAQLGEQSWGEGYYYDLLPGIVSELDPSRPYVPGSPFSAQRGQHPNDDSSGVVHEWDVWNNADYVHYRDRHPRFVSEFGFQAPPTWATLRRAVSDDVLHPDSPTLLHHQKAVDGQGKLTRGMAGHLPTPRPGSPEFDDWLWLTQLNQARAVRFGLEHFRSLSPDCTGTVVWQLNDCWPVTSWAAIDGDGRRKPLWYALAHAYRDRILTVQPGEAGLRVFAVNDLDQPWTAPLRVRRRRLDGSVIASAEFDLEAPARSTVRIDLPNSLGRADDVAREALSVSADGVDTIWTWAEDVDLDLPRPELDADVRATDEGATVHLSARTFVRDLALFVDRLHPDAAVDDMLVTLFPGDSVTFTVASPEAFDPEALISGPVLRSVGDMRG